jgi:hypothetical protein
MKPLVKTASKSDVGHGHTLHHSPARRLPTRADAPHASSSPGWADPTHMADPDINDVSMHSRHARDDISLM